MMTTTLIRQSYAILTILLVFLNLATNIVSFSHRVVPTVMQTNQKAPLALFKEIVTSFPQRSFIPPRGILGNLIKSNCHWQTIIGSEALRIKVFGSFPRNFITRTERFLTDDGDFFDVEFTENIETAIGVVVLLHGLESNTKGPLLTKMASAYLSKGFSCALISFRGCSGEDNLTPGAYHMGFTDDVKHFIQILHQRYPSVPIYISGFSLGGNVALKCVGELGERAFSDFNVRGCIATCVPFDLVASQGKIDKGFNRAVYSENFLLTLKKKAERQHSRFPNAFDIEAIRRCNTIGDFDDAYIAPIYNFKDKYDYYEKTASRWFLNRIRVPTIAINAIDDPFIEESSLPNYDDVGEIAPVRLIYHDHGGHCGFVADITSYGNEKDNDNENDRMRIATPPAHGWLAEEMARALFHIHVQHTCSELQ